MILRRSAFSLAHRLTMPFSLSRRLRQLYNPSPRNTPAAWESTTSIPNSPVPPEFINTPIDEETLPSYQPNDFHPTEPGQLLHNTYRTITKLGYGAGSTVWLAEDVRWTKHERKFPRYVVIKIATRGPGGARAATRELELCHLVATKNTSHPGTRFIRTPINSFQLEGPHGKHPCLVYYPLRETLFKFQGKLGRQRLPRPLVKLYAAYFLQALDYLHSECHLIHTDLKDDNVLMTLENLNVLEEFVHSQKTAPLPRHVRDDGRITYLSRGDMGPFQGYTMKPRLTDFDLAFPGLPDGQLHIHPTVQPARYRAPEVILGTGWSYQADIWNLGLLMWNLLEDVNVFNGLFDAEGRYDGRTHLAQMISLLGPPPQELIEREREYRDLEFEDAIPNPQGRIAKTVCEYWGGPFFDDNGRFLHEDLIQRDRTLEDTVTELKGEEKEQFLDFARCMLHWLPEKRKTAAELLEHPFIVSLEDEE